jgi:hypothetical protein
MKMNTNYSLTPNTCLFFVVCCVLVGKMGMDGSKEAKAKEKDEWKEERK